MDEDSGYRLDEPGQFRQALLTAALRQLQVPLTEISEDSDGPMEWCRPVPVDEAEALAARLPELTLGAEPAHQEAFVKIGDGQIDGAEWQLVEQSRHAGSEQQPDILAADLGLRITCFPSEAGPETHHDFAVPFNGQPRR